MPGRKFSAAAGYRYGFNGKENLPEANNLIIYDYGFRIYNPAIGRFLSVDPLRSEYPYFTPYQFAANSVIAFVDLDGLEHTKPTVDLKVPVLSQNVSESTCQGCASRNMRVAIKMKEIQLKAAYDKWKADPNYFKQRVPSEYEIFIPKTKPTEVKADKSETIKWAEAVDQTYGGILEYVPVIGDLYDIKDVATNLSKGNFAEAGLSAVFLIPGADALKPVKSVVKNDKQLLKYAKETFEGNKNLSKEATDLVDKYRKGLDGGIGGHALKGKGFEGTGISELRGKNGSSVYYRDTKEGGFEILGYSNKDNQTEVIRRLENVYGNKSN